MHPAVVGTNIRGQTDGNVFGLVLATLHSSPSQLQVFYQRFSDSLRSALSRSGIPSSQYLLYGAESLHTTVATFRSFALPKPLDEAHFLSSWQNIVHRASNRAEWPDGIENYELIMIAARVQTNGVVTLLYEDLQHVVGRMRNAVEKELETAQSKQALEEHDCSADEVKVPNIIHSTVLRWYETPSATVQELQKMVDDAFAYARAGTGQLSIPMKSVQLLRETQPYMQNRICVTEVLLNRTTRSELT